MPLVALSCLIGCGAQAGGQTGEETDGLCTFATTVLPTGEPSPLGFGAEEVLEFSEGEHVTSFDWLRDASLEYGPESGRAQATVKVVPAGPTRFARIAPERSAATCRDHVRIPVRVALATAGGALDESFQGELVASKSDEAVTAAVLPSAELKGDFAFAPGVLGERRFLRLELNLGFGPGAFTGYLFAGIESGGGSASGTASFQALPLACWGQVPSLSYVCPD